MDNMCSLATATIPNTPTKIAEMVLTNSHSDLYSSLDTRVIIQKTCYIYIYFKVCQTI